MSDQEKREKVIKGLECYLSMRRGERIVCKAEYCPYWAVDDDTGCDICNNYQIEADALNLLKAQEPNEPKVLTKDDFVGNPKCDKNGNLPVWIEYKTGLCGWTVTSAETMYTCMYAHGRQKFRYWTGKPTEEQREAVKWDD